MEEYKFVTAEVVADSINPNNGVRLTTVSVSYPRWIHGEMLTHRVFSRNASSSRAIPVDKLISMVEHDQVQPVHWGLNQAGMQAHSQAQGQVLKDAQTVWHEAMLDAVKHARRLNKLGIHKQITNRLIENFSLIKVLITSTEWDNFFTLRDHKDAQPEIQVVARKIKEQMDQSSPCIVRSATHINDKDKNCWHLPYVLEEEKQELELDLLLKISGARNARVSYFNFDHTNSDVDKDISLFNKLIQSEPLHASPIEHCAIALSCSHTDWYNNFRGWGQFRWLYENTDNWKHLV